MSKQWARAIRMAYFARKSCQCYKTAKMTLCCFVPASNPKRDIKLLMLSLAILLVKNKLCFYKGYNIEKECCSHREGLKKVAYTLCHTLKL